MPINFKQFLKILTNRKIHIFSIVVFCGAAIFLISTPVHAVSFWDLFTDPMNFVSDILISLFQLIIEFLGWLFVQFVSLLITVASFNTFTNMDMVELGWGLVRDLSNMFFIIVMLIIAYSTILKIESYHYQKTLVKLLLMAILINFSKLICGFFIDFFQVIMLTFVNGFKDVAGGNLAYGFGLYEMLSNATGDAASGFQEGAVAAAIMGVIMILVADMTILIMIAVLLWRIAMLWVLIIVSPLAYLSYAAWPKYWSQWWQMFFQHLTSGPVMAFFLWLALVALQQGSISEVFVPAQDIEGLSTDVSTATLLNYAVVMALLMGGLSISQKMASQSGGAVGAFASKVQKFGSKAGMVLTGAAAAGWAAKKAGKGAAWVGDRTRDKVSRGLVDYSIGRIGSKRMGKDGVINTSKARQSLALLTKAGREGWSSHGKDLKAKSDALAYANSLENSKKFWSGGYERIVKPWKNFEGNVKDQEGENQYFERMDGVAEIDSQQYLMMQGRAMRDKNSYQTVGAGFYKLSADGQIETTTDENGNFTGYKSLTEEEIKGMSENVAGGYVKLDKQDFMYEDGKYKDANPTKRIAWQGEDEPPESYQQTGDFVRNDDGTIKLMKAGDPGYDKAEKVREFITDENGNKVLATKENKEKYKDAKESSLGTVFTMKDRKGNWRVREFGPEGVLSKEEKEEFEKLKEKSEKSDDVIMKQGRLDRDEKGKVVTMSTEELTGKSTEELSKLSEKEISYLIAKNNVNIENIIKVNDFQKDKDGNAITAAYDEDRLKAGQISTMKVAEDPTSSWITKQMGKVGLGTRFSHADLGVSTPELQLAEARIRADYAKEYLPLSKDRFMELGARTAKMTGGEGTLRREAMVIAAANKGYLDDLMSHDKFRSQYKKLGKEKYGYDDGTYYNENLLNEFLNDYLEGTAVGQGRKQATQRTSQLIDELEDIGRDTRHFEYMGQSTFNTNTGKYEVNKMRAVVDDMGYAIDKFGNRISDLQIGKNVDLDWDDSKNGWVDKQGNMKISSADMQKGVRMAMPGMIDFAMTEWNKMGGRQKAGTAPHFFMGLRDVDGDIQLGGHLTEMHRAAVSGFKGGALRDAHHAQARLKEWIFSNGLEGDKVVIKNDVDRERFDEFLDSNPDFMKIMYAQAANKDPNRTTDIKVIDYRHNPNGETETINVNKLNQNRYMESRDSALVQHLKEVKAAVAEAEGTVLDTGKRKFEKLIMDDLSVDQNFLNQANNINEMKWEGKRLENIVDDSHFDIGKIDDYINFREVFEGMLEQINDIKTNFEVEGGVLVDQLEKLGKNLPYITASNPMSQASFNSLISQTKSQGGLSNQEIKKLIKEFTSQLNSGKSKSSDSGNVKENVIVDQHGNPYK